VSSLFILISICIVMLRFEHTTFPFSKEVSGVWALLPCGEQYPHTRTIINGRGAILSRVCTTQAKAITR
jgi:hypothetical protein